VLELLRYPPIARGLILILVSGFTFPLCGVFILRLNLLPIRYLLMHGVLLGGAIALVLGTEPSLVSLGINLLIILLLNRSARVLGSGYGALTMFLMVGAVAAASLVMSLFDVPAKDTLTLLWGSLYTAGPASIAAAVLLGAALIIFASVYFRRLTALFYNKDVALSLGINTGRFEFSIMLFIALVVSLSMRLMGALLLDALILLPAVIAGFLATGLKRMMILSCLLGGLFALTGFTLSLSLDVPVSAAVALPAVAFFLMLLILRKGKNNEKNS